MLKNQKSVLRSSLFILAFAVAALFIAGHFLITPVVINEVVHKAKLQSEVIESQLNAKFAEKAVLTHSIAITAASLPLNDETFKRQIGALIRNSRHIAGGGVWPEPGKFRADVEKSSFFWAKDEQGLYQFDEGYNQEKSPAYHKESWYLNGKQAKPGECVWSHAYVDPYSQTPMVTCSVRIERDGRFWGVATIDVDLSDLHQRLMEIEQAFGIYSLLLDGEGNVVATSLPYGLSLPMSRLDVMGHSNASYRLLYERLYEEFGPYSELPKGVLAEQESYLVSSEFAGQGWLIGLIFPESVAKEKINQLEQYLYLFVFLLGVVFSVEVLLTLAIFRKNAQLIKRIRKKSKELSEISLIDTLTQLPNQLALRAELEQRISEAHLSSQDQFAILSIDLNDFKRLNNKFSLSGGDQILQSVAQRLRAALARSYFICRFGGDEFVVVTPTYEKTSEIESACLTLLELTKKPHLINGVETQVEMSIGVACFPEDGLLANDLLKSASIAMLEAKQSNRNGFHFSSKAMNERAQHKLLVEEHLVRAIENQEIEVHFQPLINLQTGSVDKFEALLRWTSPVLGPVRPDEFIPLAESSGFIIPLGNYVLETSLAFCAQLRNHYKREFGVAVNVSPKQFNDPDFFSTVATLLDDWQQPASCLTLEITEGVLIDNRTNAEALFAKLLTLGVQVAMDDFGTGYSSLSYVRNYPFNIVKIDKEFIDECVTDEKSRRLVETVLAMAQSLGCEVVAEGVELEQQAQLLTEKGCDYGQGYLYSRALSAKEMESWLVEQGYV